MIFGIAAAALVVAVLVTVSRDRALERARGFADVPLRAFAECRDGERVRVVGVVELDERVLRAPSDGARCAFYACDYFAVRYESVNRIETRYASSAHAVPFWIVSDGQRARVDAKVLDVTTDDVWVQEIDGDALPKGIRKQLRRSAPDAAAAPCTRYVERRLVPGTRVTVVGIARRVEGAAALPITAGYRGGREPELVLTITARKGGSVRVSTDEATRR